MVAVFPPPSVRVVRIILYCYVEILCVAFCILCCIDSNFCKNWSEEY